jgi:hypothetical protein
MKIQLQNDHWRVAMVTAIEDVGSVDEAVHYTMAKDKPGLVTAN